MANCKQWGREWGWSGVGAWTGLYSASTAYLTLKKKEQKSTCIISLECKRKHNF